MMLRTAARRFHTSTMTADKVAFIGLGNMGGPMAQNLVKAGHELQVYDLSEAAVKSVTDLGARAARSPEEAAKDTDVVVTMLPSSPHVESVYLQSELMDMAKTGSLFIDCSTIDPNVSRKVAAAASARGFRMVDAPVSGGVGGAAAGTLTFMVGGSADDFEASKSVLKNMGKNIVHCGDSGTGQVAKICNNLVLGISMAAVSEAMNLGKKLGIDPTVLAGIINTSSGRCWSSDTYNPCPGVMEGVPSSRGYTGGFGTALMQKDLGLAVDAAKSVNAPLPTGGIALSLYTTLTANGLGRSDFSAVHAFLAGEVDKYVKKQ